MGGGHFAPEWVVTFPGICSMQKLDIEKKAIKMYPRKAKIDYLNFAKKKRKGKKEIGKVRKKMLSHLKRNLGHMEMLLEELKKLGYEIRKKFRDKYNTASKIYSHQKEMHEKGVHSVEDRILSFCKPGVRPIIRVKAGNKLEFGPRR